MKIIIACIVCSMWSYGWGIFIGWQMRKRLG